MREMEGRRERGREGEREGEREGWKEMKIDRREKVIIIRFLIYSKIQ